MKTYIMALITLLFLSTQINCNLPLRIFFKPSAPKNILKTGSLIVGSIVVSNLALLSLTHRNGRQDDRSNALRYWRWAR